MVIDYYEKIVHVSKGTTYNQGLYFVTEKLTELQIKYLENDANHFKTSKPHVAEKQTSA